MNNKNYTEIKANKITLINNNGTENDIIDVIENTSISPSTDLIVNTLTASNIYNKTYIDSIITPSGGGNISIDYGNQYSINSSNDGTNYKLNFNFMDDIGPSPTDSLINLININRNINTGQNSLNIDGTNIINEINLKRNISDSYNIETTDFLISGKQNLLNGLYNNITCLSIMTPTINTNNLNISNNSSIFQNSTSLNINHLNTVNLNLNNTIQIQADTSGITLNNMTTINGALSVFGNVLASNLYSTTQIDGMYALKQNLLSSSITNNITCLSIMTPTLTATNHYNSSQIDTLLNTKQATLNSGVNVTTGNITIGSLFSSAGGFSLAGTNSTIAIGTSSASNGARIDGYTDSTKTVAKAIVFQGITDGGGIQFGSNGSTTVGLSFGSTPSSTINIKCSLDAVQKPTTSTWQISSDRKFKTNIQPDNSEYGYNNMKNLKIRRFTYTDEFIKKHNITEEQDKTKIGVIAQEMLENPCMKKYVTKSITEYDDERENEEFLTVNIDALIWQSFSCIQHLIKKVEILESKINS
jgi:hypothetical protein